MTDAEKLKNEFNFSLLKKNESGLKNLEQKVSADKIDIGLLKEDCTDLESKYESLLSSYNALSTALNTLTSSFESHKADMFKSVYPVGSVYISVNSTSPATLFGGSWTQIQGRFLLAASSTYTAGTTGGAETHSHSLTSAYAAIGLFTSEKLIAHSTYAADFTANRHTSVSTTATNASRAMSRGTKINGNTDSASNLPPYLAVYVWKRTA